MRHEILFLKPSRAYVLVDEVWYDTPRDSNPQVGQSFLIGKIEEVLDYEKYMKKYPESKEPMYEYVTDKTISGGYVRRVIDGMVKYAVNPATPTVGSSTRKESIED
jgi:hypothetical protein